VLKPLLMDLATSNQRSQQRDPQALGVFFVGGWLTRDDGGERWLTDDEFRRVLTGAREALRTHVLWQVGRFEFAEKIAFLRRVWPLQLTVRTPIVVGRLCTLAFDDKNHFPELVSAILPLVSDAQIGRVAWQPPHDKTETIANYPDQVLELLAVMPTGRRGRLAVRCRPNAGASDQG
jgi:hypothetical protein